jgi:hypothetical protein
VGDRGQGRVVARAFANRYPSVLRALVALGVEEPEARKLIHQTKAAGRSDICITVGGLALVIRRMRGNHADVYELDERADCQHTGRPR